MSPEHLAGLVELIHDGTVSGKMAKSVFEKMFATSQSAREALDHLGIRQITDSGEILNVIRTVIAASPKQLEQYRGGKSNLFGYFVGQVMKATGGQANPQKLNELLKEELSK